MKNICLIGGTRPEIIKLAPVFRKFRESGKDRYRSYFCMTGQHKSLAEKALEVFDIVPDFNLNIMDTDQTLNSIASKIFELLPVIYNKIKPDLVFVQGDTTSAAIAGLAAFYNKIPVGHIEAGLRSYNLDAPFPEEMNRRIISHLGRFNFVPTQKAKEALLKENINSNSIFITGNTVVDAIKFVQNKFNLEEIYRTSFDNPSPFILITAHRRESFGPGFENICNAISASALKHPDIKYIYPVHLNPNVRNPVERILSRIPNVCLLGPVSYIELLSLLNKCIFCLTDSGGIQEEAPSFNKYTIVMRDNTERMESVELGLSELTGTDKEKIVEAIDRQFNNHKTAKRQKFINPYGEGDSSDKIFKIIDNYFYSC